MTNEIPVHEAASLIPPMSDDEYRRLVEDIREYGQREPIVLHEGEIIDGRHRYRACQELGIQPDFTVWEGEGSLVAYVVSKNFHRRHLSEGQKALLAVPIARAFEAEAHEREYAGVAQDPAQNFEQGRSAYRAAKAVGVNRQYVYDAQRITEEAPDVVPLIQSNTVSMNTAREIAALPAEVRAPIVAEAMRAPPDEARRQVRNLTKKHRQERERQQAQEEVDTAAAIMSVVGDPNGELARGRLGIEGMELIAEVRQMLQKLDPTVYVPVLEETEQFLLRSLAHDARRWADGVEAQLNQGIRLVSKEG